MAKERGLLVPGAAEEDPALGREFMQDPEGFARKHGLDPAALECPEAAHAAFERATAFKKEVESSAIKPTRDSLAGLQALAARHFGEEHEVALIPFGLKFRERADHGPRDATATGSGTITFLDGDADLDA